MEQFPTFPSNPEEQKEKFHTPFYAPTLEAFAKEIPEKEKSLEKVLNEIDTQAIGNFAVYKSETMPDVSFSYTKLTITPETIERLRGRIPSESEGMIPEKEIGEEGEEKTNAGKQHYFLFTAFSPPPGGNAFTVEDVGIDRFIRLLPRVARPLNAGEPVPAVEIYLLGAPTGFGGSVSKEWIENVKASGLETHGKLYAEFIAKHVPHEVPKDLEDTHVVLQGVSKGAVAAAKTLKYLPEEIASSTQRLLDNPAGDHEGGTVSRWIKGSQAALGLIGETVSRMLFDDMLKGLMKTDKGFIDALSEKTGIAKDDEETLKLKRGAVFAEAVALLKGTDLDTDENRAFIRRGVLDPLTFNPKRFMDTLQKETPTVPLFKKGKAMEAPFKGHHFFIYNRYKRWAKILDYVENSSE